MLSSFIARYPVENRDNSLNLIRLILACAVVVSHAHILTGTGDGFGWQGETLGGWAVIGFFCISGFLISGSRERSRPERYLLNRVARIFPGFILSLLAVVLVFAPLAYLLERGTLSGYFSGGGGVAPLNHLLLNMGLKMQEYSVAGTLGGVPHPAAWNGSLWSLYYEFLCYVIIGIFLSFAFAKNKIWPTAALFVVSVVIHAAMPKLLGYVNNNQDAVLLAKLLPYFLSGALLWQLREKLTLRYYFAIPALIVGLGMVLLNQRVGGQIASPLFVYFVMWVGAVLPSPRWIKTNDLSYGTYIFSFPITQLMVLMGASSWGFIPFVVVLIVFTLIAALGSWFLVEQPIMRLAKGKKITAAAAQSK